MYGYGFTLLCQLPKDRRTPEEVIWPWGQQILRQEFHGDTSCQEEQNFTRTDPTDVCGLAFVHLGGCIRTAQSIHGSLFNTVPFDSGIHMGARIVFECCLWKTPSPAMHSSAHNHVDVFCWSLRHCIHVRKNCSASPSIG